MIAPAPPCPQGTTPQPPEPTARYDEKGSLYVSFPVEIAESPVFPLLRFTLTSCLPLSSFEWEPAGDTLFVEWRSARVAERTLRDLWPAAAIVAQANPQYAGVRG